MNPIHEKGQKLFSLLLITKTVVALISKSHGGSAALRYLNPTHIKGQKFFKKFMPFVNLTLILLKYEFRHMKNCTKKYPKYERTRTQVITLKIYVENYFSKSQLEVNNNAWYVEMRKMLGLQILSFISFSFYHIYSINVTLVTLQLSFHNHYTVFISCK